MRSLKTIFPPYTFRSGDGSEAGLYRIGGYRAAQCRAPRHVGTKANVLFALVGLVWVLSAGCASRDGPIFEPPDPLIRWPSPPAPARIAYVGSLRQADDLKPPKKILSSIGNFFVGRKPPQPLYGPRDVVCSRDGRYVWIADPGGRCLHRFDLVDRTYEKITTIDGQPVFTPVGVCLGPPGSILVCDSEAVAIHRLSISNGASLGSLRLPEDVLRPTAAAYDPAHDELFVVDVSAHDVKVLGLDGSLRRLIGRRGNRAGEFNFPTAIAVLGDDIWVVDTGNNRVQRLTRLGQPVGIIGKAGDAPGDLALPRDLAFDSDGNLYVVDARFENVQVFDRAGRLLLFFGEEGHGPGEFWLPGGIHIDAQDRIWICDSYNGRVQVFDYLRPEPRDDTAPWER